MTAVSQKLRQIIGFDVAYFDMVYPGGHVCKMGNGKMGGEDLAFSFLLKNVWKGVEAPKLTGTFFLYRNHSVVEAKWI